MAAVLTDLPHEVAASDAWGLAWLAVYGEPYRGWDLHHGAKSKDRRRRADLARAARIPPLVQGELLDLSAVVHLQECTERYLRDHLAGQAFPEGGKATSFAAWVSVAPQYLARVRPSSQSQSAKASPAPLRLSEQDRENLRAAGLELPDEEAWSLPPSPLHLVSG